MKPDHVPVPPAGVGVDAHGGAVIDPTANVIALTDAAVTRLDDLAFLQAQLVDEKIKRLEIAAIYTDKIAVLRAEHTKEMRESESKRLDAVRATDVAAVSTAATQAQAAITALASTATSTAETLRNQVASTALTIANQTDRIVSPILDRIATLEKLSYTGLGKQAVVDPQMERLSTLVERLVARDSSVSGKSEGINASWLVLVAVIGIVLSGLFLYGASKPSAAAPAPQVIYVPSPAGTLLPTTPPSTVPR